MMLSIKDLAVGFRTRRGEVQAVRGISLELAKGETLGIVGESGSGKSVTSFALMRILDAGGSITAGEVTYSGIDLRRASERDLRSIRGREISMIFQNPRAALNPIRKVGHQIEDVLRQHARATRGNAREKAIQALRDVRINDAEARYHAYPFELSGGMCQRIVIALALACDPRLLIADEPTTGLDITTQKAVMDLSLELIRERGMASILITHDLGLAAQYCDRLAVMKDGEIVETGPAEDVFANPQHDYTRRLVEATPRPDASVRSLLPADRRPPEIDYTPSDQPLLEVRDLRKTYVGKAGPVHVVKGISFTVNQGQSVGLVGESGCGKSTTSSMLVRLLDPTEGQILYQGNDLAQIPAEQFGKHPLRGDIQMVFQDATDSLNPRHSAGDCIAEPLRRLAGLRSPFPHPRNATDPALVPGGSSSGSAVAVAQGLVPFALGTDTAGSGRVPAALNNLVGLKPTLGAISNRGVVPACRSLDCVSIFALNIDDAISVLSVANNYDAADAYARPFSLPATSAPLPNPVIGVPNAASLRFFDDALQADAFEATLAQLEAQGANIERIDFTPFYQVTDLLYHGAWIAERTLVIDDLLNNTPDALHPVTRQIIEPGQKLTAMDAFKGLYQLQALRKTCQAILKRFDYLCVPSIPTFYTTADLEADPIGPNNRLGTYTNFVNLLDLCALTVPCPPRSDGRPGSVTFIGTHGKDSLLASEGHRLEAWAKVSPGNTGWPYQSAPAPAASATNDEVILAVCGAHMSGLPLNHELTSRGGRFIEKTETAPQYKLFALAGGPPYRPGLVRQETEGVAVALELWALPKKAVGDFISGIPSPLGIGTVVLNDQRQVKGFVCEAAGLGGAEDISALGSWRVFLQSA